MSGEPGWAQLLPVRLRLPENGAAGSLASPAGAGYRGFSAPEPGRSAQLARRRSAAGRPRSTPRRFRLKRRDYVKSDVPMPAVHYARVFNHAGVAVRRNRLGWFRRSGAATEASSLVQ